MPILMSFMLYRHF